MEPATSSRTDNKMKRQNAGEEKNIFNILDLHRPSCASSAHSSFTTDLDSKVTFDTNVSQGDWMETDKHNARIRAGADYSAIQLLFIGNALETPPPSKLPPPPLPSPDMMKLCAVMMFITFLLHQEARSQILLLLQICQEYGMTLFSIKRHNFSIMELLIDKVRKFIEGSKGQIMLEAFVCQRHLEHGNGK
ncbi:Hypothetical predicted protein [Octopus vulgaris]|uniref:Uncharacterized protein n=1 Tax=Octopus vulgaris TaxID=6645 RepID=A0AA36AVF5_OCTVU|nr:Hypothetical predicted protein [Octopus vulgaris]